MPDIEVRKTNKVAGFELDEPLRKADEGLCCPSEGVVTTYKYSPSDSFDNQFYSYDERVEVYETFFGESQVKETPKKKAAPKTPSPTPTLTPTQAPDSSKNTGKQEALKAIESRINQINKEGSRLQAMVNSLLQQEEQDTCNTDRYSNPDSEMYIEDPFARESLCAQRSQTILAPINQIQARINTLIQERNALERQKIEIMSR